MASFLVSNTCIVVLGLGSLAQDVHPNPEVHHLSYLLSITPSSQTQPQPSTPPVPQWWNTIDRVYLEKAGKRKKKTKVVSANQVSNGKCSMGKSLKTSQIPELAAEAGPKKGGIALVFTAEDVAVEGFCMSR
ncbi:hypothetical protein OPV22_023685 [Ensete ventricosum]|uniref:Uncharacterized protein n=1 Tax=Ensete ventricosum TaxID=4639 RepID=A0AAV8QR79_ENSVE|nr:hypothetical protein OPV22_023685 [Ensete ventricosum]